MLFISKGGNTMQETVPARLGVLEVAIVVLVAALLISIPVVVNSKRKKRGEARFHSPRTIAMVVGITVAAFGALIASLFSEIPWGIAMSAVSLAALWMGLMAMLSRGVRREAVVTDDHASDARPFGGDSGMQGGTYGSGPQYGFPPQGGTYAPAPQNSMYGPASQTQPFNPWPQTQAFAPGPQSETIAAKPQGSRLSALEISTQVAGILSLIVSVIALFKG
jgi:hypothetical protein